MPERTTLTNIGRLAFACGIGGLGVLALVTADAVAGLEPLPHWFSNHLVVAYLTGLGFIVSALCMIAKRWVTLAAAFVAGVLLVWLALLQLPQLLAALHDGDAWTTFLETAALLSVATIVLRHWAPVGIARVWRAPPVPVRVLQVTFALALLGFGILHLIYHRYVAYLIPSWLPWHEFWAYFTGVAFIAAGTSMLIRVRARTGSWLTGVMFGAWVLMLHSPRVAVRLHDRLEWTSLFIALAMCGGALLVGETFRTERRPVTAEPTARTPVVAR